MIKGAETLSFCGIMGEGLDLYQEQFNELHQLVKTYTTLLETDIALMAATGKEMHRTDNVLGQNMFPGLQ
ncbi:hypothetical protein D8846_09270 [Streptococcus oralis]|nr:hypothetical protein D8846_09270 [Streptococcus oralis]